MRTRRQHNTSRVVVAVVLEVAVTVAAAASPTAHADTSFEKGKLLDIVLLDIVLPRLRSVFRQLGVTERENILPGQ